MSKRVSLRFPAGDGHKWAGIVTSWGEFNGPAIDRRHVTPTGRIYAAVDDLIFLGTGYDACPWSENTSFAVVGKQRELKYLSADEAKELCRQRGVLK